MFYFDFRACSHVCQLYVKKVKMLKQRKSQFWGNEAKLSVVCVLVVVFQSWQQQKMLEY